MKMELSTKDFPVFKDWINALKTVNEEHTIEAREDGLHCMAMDPSHVAMIDTKFGFEIFEEYSITPGPLDKELVCLNVSELSKFLSRIGKDERVTLRKDTAKAKFIIETTKSGRDRNFKINIMDDFEGEVPKPKLLFKTKSRITLDGFEEALKDAGLVSEHIVIEVKNDKLRLEGIGDMGNTLMEWTTASDDILELKIEEEAKATFTLSYIDEMVKAMKPLAEVLNVELSTDMPVSIECECNNRYMELKFFLAPCIGV